jgi:OOP family OmpA-OmpF porin
VFAYQGIAGISYDLTPNVSLAVDYRYFATTEGNFHDEYGGSFKSTYHSHNAFLNIVYHFAPPAPLPPPAAAPAPAPQPAAAPAPAPVAQPRLFIVFFDFDKYNLTPDARKVVEEAANAYKAGGSAKVTLAGYTDLSGPAGYNMKLSERRAKAVAAAMVKLGVPESAMDVSWHGKENPRVPTPDGVREPQNRRVEITE